MRKKLNAKVEVIPYTNLVCKSYAKPTDSEQKIICKSTKETTVKKVDILIYENPDDTKLHPA